MIEYHLLPVIRAAVSRLSTGARYSLAGCAALALAELLLLLLRLPLPGILCGMGSTFMLSVSLALLTIAAMWGHTVLLAGQGVFITRWLLRVCAILAPVAPVSWLVLIITGAPLLYRQAEIPFMLAGLLLAAATVNIPRMAAAPWQLQLRIVLVPVLLLVVLVCDLPGMLLPCIAAKILVWWVAAKPLRLLAWAAPRIISMPEADPPPGKEENSQ